MPVDKRAALLAYLKGYTVQPDVSGDPAAPTVAEVATTLLHAEFEKIVAQLTESEVNALVIMPEPEFDAAGIKLEIEEWMTAP